VLYCAVALSTSHFITARPLATTLDFLLTCTRIRSPVVTAHYHIYYFRPPSISLPAPGAKWENSIHNPRHPTHIATKARIFTRGAPPLALFGSVFASESRSFRIRCLSLYTMNILRSFHECAFFFCSSSRFGIGPLPFFFTFSPWNIFLVLTFPTYMNTSFRVSAPFHFPPWQCFNFTIPLPFYLVFPILKIATCVAVVGRLELGKG